MSRTDWHSLFTGGRGPLIGMVHLPALPGAPMHDHHAGMTSIVDRARHDVDALVEAGFDAVLFVNEGDAPYANRADPSSAAAFTAVVARTAPTTIPFGVEFLFDPIESLSCAVATGASFIRAGVIGAWETTSGVRLGGAADLLRARSALRAEHIGVFSVAEAELAFPLSAVALEQRVRTAAQEGAMDAVLVGGSLPGVAVDTGAAERVRAAVRQVIPVLANSGVRSDTVLEVLANFDGCFVGSSIKAGSLHDPIDPTRARELVAAAGPREVAAG